MKRAHRSIWLPTVLVASVAVLPFLPTLSASYLADDWFFVAAYRSNADSYPALFWRALSSLGATPTTFYRPLPFMSLAAQVRLGQTDVAMHVVNLALHGAVSAALFAMAFRLTRGSTIAAGLATLGFAWFPRRTEAVAWLSCRPDLLAALFTIAMLLAFESSTRTRFKRWLAVAVALWWLAVLSKEAAALGALACVPLVAAPPDQAPGPTERRDRAPGWPVWWLMPFLLSLPAYLAVRRLAVGAWVGGYGADSVAIGPGTLVSGLKHLVYQLVPPLAALEPVVRTGTGGAMTSLAILLLSAACAVVIWRSRREPATRVGVALLVAAIVPVMALPVSLTTTFNDRLLYLPGVGMALVVAGVIARRPRITTVVPVLIVLAGLGVWSWELSGRWARAGALSSHTLTQLKRAVDGEPAARIYLAAVPDSIGGAYLLRNGVREALAVAGARRPERVAVLSWYFVDPGEPAARPISASRASPDVVLLESSTAAPQIIAGTPDAQDLAEYQAPATTDRLGRRRTARIRVFEPGVFWLVTPGGIEQIDGGSP